MRPKENAPAPAPMSVPVAIYARVSTSKQVGLRFESCDSQAAICRDYLARRADAGWYEVACLSDPAYSGGSMRRPGMEALKRLIEAGEVKVVLIFKFERVLRSTDEWGPFRALLKKHGCRLESPSEDLGENTAFGRYQNNLRASQAEYERLNTAEKTAAKMLEQAKRGIWNGGMIPFGYSYDEKKQELHPDPTDAPIVRRIYEHAAKLGSLTDLANALNAEGLRTKSRIFRRRDGTDVTVGGRLFRSDGLRLIIRNPIYRGAMRYDAQEFQGRHPAIVPRELWDQANAGVTETTRRPAELIVERDRHLNLLKGLAWCGDCNRSLVPHQSGKPSPTGKPYRYYYCGFVMKERQPRACAVGRLSADALERVVLGFLGEVGKHPTLISGMLEEARTRNRGDRRALGAELESAERAVSAVAKELDNCAEAVAKGGLQALGEALTRRAEQLALKHQQLTIAREKKRQELAACESSLFDEQRIKNSIQELGAILPALEPEKQKELVGLFVQRVEVRSVPAKARAKVDEDRPRLLALRVKLCLPQLVQGMEARQDLKTSLRLAPVTARGVSFEARVDFTHAMNGEITILAPFEHSVRVAARVRPAPAPKPEAEHAIVRAIKWHELLASGKVATRMALAKREGLTPGAVTRILKLLELMPEIRNFLAALKSGPEVRCFPIKEVGQLASLPAEKQRIEFAAMQRRCAMRIG